MCIATSTVYRKIKNKLGQTVSLATKLLEEKKEKERYLGSKKDHDIYWLYWQG
jgi:hypothetical protein